MSIDFVEGDHGWLVTGTTVSRGLPLTCTSHRLFFFGRRKQSGSTIEVRSIDCKTLVSTASGGLFFCRGPTLRDVLAIAWLLWPSIGWSCGMMRTSHKTRKKLIARQTEAQTEDSKDEIHPPLFLVDRGRRERYRPYSLHATCHAITFRVFNKSSRMLRLTVTFFSLSFASVRFVG